MSVTLALVVGGLTSVGVYLITSRSLTRMLLGFALPVRGRAGAARRRR